MFKVSKLKIYSFFPGIHKTFLCTCVQVYGCRPQSLTFKHILCLPMAFFFPGSSEYLHGWGCPTNSLVLRLTSLHWRLFFPLTWLEFPLLQCPHCLPFFLCPLWEGVSSVFSLTTHQEPADSNEACLHAFGLLWWRLGSWSGSPWMSCARQTLGPPAQLSLAQEPSTGHGTPDSLSTAE